jgi:hypothetical protein
MSKGTRFWGFLGSRGRGIIGGISFIPLNVASFSGLNLGHGVPMRCFYYTQSLLQIRGANREIESWIRGGWPTGAIHPESSGHTGLTRANSLLSFARVNVLVCSLLSRVAVLLSLVNFGAW